VFWRAFFAVFDLGDPGQSRVREGESRVAVKAKWRFRLYRDENERSMGKAGWKRERRTGHPVGMALHFVRDAVLPAGKFGEGKRIGGHDLKGDWVDAALDHLELFGGGVGEVDDALWEEDAAVGDGDDD
jgi:hypothetical protein